MKYKGTQGPWKVFPIENRGHHHTYYKVGDSDTDDVRHGTSICNVTTRNSEQAEANAKLIASAPDMLLTLIVVRDLYGSGSGQIYNLLTEAIDKAV